MHSFPLLCFPSSLICRKTVYNFLENYYLSWKSDRYYCNQTGSPGLVNEGSMAEQS